MIVYEDLLGDSYNVELEVMLSNNRIKIIELKKNGMIWFSEDLPLEKQIIYKFKINKKFYVNDPKANYYKLDKSGMVWSVKERHDCEKRIVPTVNNIIITDRVWNDIQKAVRKSSINICYDRKVVIGVIINDLFGIHSITFIWHQPDGRIFRVEEKCLNISCEMGIANAGVWTWLNTYDLKGEFIIGVWCVDILLDGKMVAREYVAIGYNDFCTSYRIDIVL